MARWKKWIIARKNLLLDESENEVKKAFARVFQIEDSFMVNGKLSKDARLELPPALAKIFDTLRPTTETEKKRTAKRIDELIKLNNSDVTISPDEDLTTEVDTDEETSEEQENDDSFQKVNIPKKNEIFIR